MIKTVSLTANIESDIEILGGSHCRITNYGTDTMYASSHINVVANDDNVLAIPANETRVLHGISGHVELISSSAATVELETSDSGNFNTGAGKVVNHEYGVVSTESTSYANVYRMTCDGEPVGDPINIPKDMVVQSGTVETCMTENVPVVGYQVGDRYVDLMIANTAGEHIYILASDLVATTAAAISYNNTSSGLAATSVQGAVDELAGRGSPYIYMTQAEYEAITPVIGQKYWVTYPLSGCYLVWLNGEAIDGIGASPVAGYTLANDNSSYKSYATTQAKQLAIAYNPTGSHGDACSPSLKKLDIAKGVTEIGNSAFEISRNLTEINIPNSITSIGTYAFSGCTSLAEINIPNSVTSIGTYAFSGCTSLAEINIPNSVTSIDTYAFSGCTSLAEINIPNSVTSIRASAFSNCSNLTNFNFAGTKAQWNSVTLGSSWKYNAPFAVVHCSDGDSTRLS